MSAPLPCVCSGTGTDVGDVEQGLFLPLLQLLWCFGFVNTYGCWGCVGGAAGIGATTSLTYRISQFDANWVALGVALWSLVLIVASEAAFMWQEQVALRSASTLLPALLTLWFLYKSVSLVCFCFWVKRKCIHLSYICCNFSRFCNVNVFRCSTVDVRVRSKSHLVTACGRPFWTFRPRQNGKASTPWPRQASLQQRQRERWLYHITK